MKTLNYFKNELLKYLIKRICVLWGFNVYCHQKETQRENIHWLDLCYLKYNRNASQARKNNRASFIVLLRKSNRFVDPANVCRHNLWMYSLNSSHLKKSYFRNVSVWNKWMIKISFWLHAIIFPSSSLQENKCVTLFITLIKWHKIIPLGFSFNQILD